MASLVSTAHSQKGGTSGGNNETKTERMPWPAGNLANVISSPETLGFSSTSLWSLLGEDGQGPDIFLYVGSKLLGRLKDFFVKGEEGTPSCVTHISHAWHSSNMLICTYGMQGGVFRVTEQHEIVLLDSFQTHFQTLDSALSLWDNTYACVYGGQDGAMLRLETVESGGEGSLTHVNTIHLKEGICACCIVDSGNRVPKVALAGKDGRCFMININLEALGQSHSKAATENACNEFSIVMEQGEGRITHAKFSPCDQFVTFSFWNGHCRVYRCLDGPDRNVWVQMFVVKNPGTAIPSSAPSFSHWVPYRNEHGGALGNPVGTPFYVLLLYKGKDKTWGSYDICTSSRLYDIELQLNKMVGEHACSGVILGYDDSEKPNPSIHLRAFMHGQNGGKSTFGTTINTSLER
jgi:hypothetical protein